MSFKSLGLAIIGGLALAGSTVASAAIVTTVNIGETKSDGAGGTVEFLLVSPNPFPGLDYDGPIKAEFSHVFDFSSDPNATQEFTDTFTFRVPTNGTGSGSFSANGSSVLDSLTFSNVSGDVTFSNGTETFNVPIFNGKLGLLENVPIFQFALNTLTINGVAHGKAFYKGSASFTPNAIAAVPEAATWSMMIIGFGAVGGALRVRRRKEGAAQNDQTALN